MQSGIDQAQIGEIACYLVKRLPEFEKIPGFISLSIVINAHAPGRINFILILLEREIPANAPEFALIPRTITVETPLGMQMFPVRYADDDSPRLHSARRGMSAELRTTFDDLLAKMPRPSVRT